MPNFTVSQFGNIFLSNREIVGSVRSILGLTDNRTNIERKKLVWFDFIG